MATAKKTTARTTAPKPKLTGKAVLNAVRRNQLKPVEVAEIYQACAEAMSKGAVGLRWRFDLDPIEVHFGEDDMTTDMMNQAEASVGVSSDSFNLQGSTRHASAIAVAYLTVGVGWEREQAERLIGQVPVNELLGAFTTEAVGPDPKGVRAWRSALETS